MEFQIPQFIERETKIVGPLTIKQFGYIAAAGVCSLVLYFYLAEKNLVLFLIITMILIGSALSLAFVQIEGRSLPSVLINFFFFSLSPKIFLWKRKIFPPKIIKEEEKEKTEEEPLLKISKKSHLEKLSFQIESRPT